MVKAREYIDREQERVGTKFSDKKGPFPNLDFRNFQYFFQVKCDKCPFYSDRYDGKKDYVQQTWDNSFGSNILTAFLPNGHTKYYREGPETIIRKGERVEITSIDYPAGHFQSARIAGVVQYTDEHGERQKQVIAFINLYKAKVPLFEGDKAGNTRFGALQVLPGPGIIGKIRLSTLTMKLLTPDVLGSGVPPTKEDVGIGPQEVAALKEFLTKKFNSPANARNIAAKARSRSELADIEMEYLRAHGILSHDDEVKHRQSQVEIRRAIVNFFKDQCHESAPTETERARRTAVRARCEETESTTVNVAVLKKYMDFTSLRGFGYDGIQPADVRKHVNNLLAGDPSVLGTLANEMEPGCWVPVRPMMVKLQEMLSLAKAQYTHDPNDGSPVVRGVFCSVHKVILALADATQCPFEVRLQLGCAPADNHTAMAQHTSRGGTRYWVIPSQGTDVGLGVTSVQKWAFTHEEHMKFTDFRNTALQ